MFPSFSEKHHEEQDEIIWVWIEFDENDNPTTLPPPLEDPDNPPPPPDDDGDDDDIDRDGDDDGNVIDDEGKTMYAQGNDKDNEGTEGGTNGGGTGIAQPFGPDSGDQALDTFCERLKLNPPPPTSLDDLNQRAAETDCLDPVINPAPMHRREMTFTCRAQEEGRSALNIVEILGHDEKGNDCNFSREPGPGERCGDMPFRGGARAGGTYWLSLGDILGIDACGSNPGCDPSELP